MIQRKLIIALITSTRFLKKIKPVLQIELIEGTYLQTLSQWCLDFYKHHEKAPGEDITAIYFDKVKQLDKGVAEDIEELLESLSNEFENNTLDVELLFKQSVIYLRTRQEVKQAEEIETILNHGQGSIEDRLQQVEELKERNKPIQLIEDESVDLSSKKVLKNIKIAFQQSSEPIVHFAKQLGLFWNHSFIAGALISLLAPEKRGKTYMLLHIAITAAREGKKVAFFQAGDMNEADQLKRIGVHLCQRSNLEKYCKEHYRVTRDCRFQQMDTCTEKERECEFSPLDDFQQDNIDKLTFKELKDCYENYPEYKPCYNCNKFDDFKLGVPWLKKIPVAKPITYKDAQKAVEKFFIKYKRGFKLSTHPNGTLSINDISNILDDWEVNEGFIADLILIDYADLLVPNIRVEHRHQQNEIWKNLRKLSQTKRGNKLPLVITPTQADADSYKRDVLGMDNFSEDKRKNAHPTSIYGLNQDVKGREKDFGLLRINEILLREGESSKNNMVTVVQDLNQGRPVVESYFN